MTQTIVYSSYANLPDNCDPERRPEWLDDLVEKASIKNRTLNISGVLGYKNGKILQLIEGETDEIQRLFGKILDDALHRDVRTLIKLDDSTRIFTDWGMVLEPEMTASLSFRDFLYAHIDNLVEMSASESDELIFFVDHIFHEVVASKQS